MFADVSDTPAAWMHQAPIIYRDDGGIPTLRHVGTSLPQTTWRHITTDYNLRLCSVSGISVMTLCSNKHLVNLRVPYIKLPTCSACNLNSASWCEDFDLILCIYTAGLGKGLIYLQTIPGPETMADSAGKSDNLIAGLWPLFIFKNITLWRKSPCCHSSNSSAN